MQFGTEVPREGSKWGSMNEVALTSEGLVTPTKPVAIPAPAEVTQRTSRPAERAIVTLAPSTGHTAPAARQADPVRQALLRLDIALRDHPRRILGAMEVIRRPLETDQKPDDVARLRIALARGERWLEERARLRRTVVERLKERPTPELYGQAVELVKDPDASADEREAVAAAAARAQRAQQQQRAAQEREQAERREARERKRAAARERHVHQDRVEKVEKLVPAVRGALKKAAREQRTTTWPQIQQKTGMHQLGRLDHQDKVELLALVESDTPTRHPCGRLSSPLPAPAPRYASTAMSPTVSAGPCPSATPTSSTNSPPNALNCTASGGSRDLNEGCSARQPRCAVHGLSDG
jgi:type II secretory pathway pseudopilin PulG